MPGAVRVAVRLTPRAARTIVAGLKQTTAGTVLAIHVTAPPEAGKANAALQKLLAKTWRVPKGAIQLTAGASDRNKVLSVADPEGVILPRLQQWLERINPA